jgi:hypothetical protein
MVIGCRCIIGRWDENMGLKQRFARIRLLHGGYIGTSGRPQNYAGPAAIFRYEQAYQFLRDTRIYDRSDYLWGASVEMLEKRKDWATVAVTDEQFQHMLASATLVRLEMEAAKYETLAESYQRQAKHNTERAVEYRLKAAEVRERLKEKV